MGVRPVFCDSRASKDSSQGQIIHTKSPFKHYRAGLTRIPDEILLLILSFLPPPAQIVLGLTCQSLNYKIEPQLLIFKQNPPQTQPHLTHLHLLKRDISKSWICHKCGIIHINLVHPSFSTSNYIENLQEWKNFLPTSPVLAKGVVITTPHSYRFPTCAAYEVQPYTDILNESSTPYIDHKIEHFYRTQTCDLRITTKLSFIRLLNPLQNLLQDSTQTSPPNNQHDSPARQPKILTHTRHTILFNPQGNQIFSPTSILTQALSLKIDICQHIRLSSDIHDEGNILMGILCCSSRIYHRLLPDIQQSRGVDISTLGFDEFNSYKASHRSCRRGKKRRGRQDHYFVCKECAVEGAVFFDPCGFVSGQLGDGILKVDVWKELTSALSTEVEGRNDHTSWDRRVGLVETDWNSLREDPWRCFDEEGVLSLLG